MFAIVVAFRW